MTRRDRPKAPFTLSRWTLLAALLALLLSREARAANVLPDDDGRFGVDLDDRATHELLPDGASSGSLWVALQAKLAQRDEGKTDVGAMLLIGLPLERLGAPRGRARGAASTIAEGAKTRGEKATASKEIDAAKASGEDAFSAEASEPKRQEARVEDRSSDRVVVTPGVARAAVAAALEHARLDEREARIDRAASRARRSALLPELRLRVTRLLDEAQTLSPTEYDPDRITASGGTSLWLEARATFRLDRLVFADEEVALERMREERFVARQKLEARVLDVLFAWQRACATRDDPAGDPEARARAEISVMEADATLDVLTGGFWSRWKDARSREDAATRR